MPSIVHTNGLGGIARMRLCDIFYGLWSLKLECWACGLVGELEDRGFWYILVPNSEI
jgi:hypothetical protein